MLSNVAMVISEGFGAENSPDTAGARVMPRATLWYSGLVLSSRASRPPCWSAIPAATAAPPATSRSSRTSPRPGTGTVLGLPSLSSSIRLRPVLLPLEELGHHQAGDPVEGAAGV